MGEGEEVKGLRASLVGGREDVVLVQEGGLRFYAPKASLLRKDPPKGPAFYNPSSSFSRDVSVVIGSALAKLWMREPSPSFLDALAGVGVRGLRIAKEVEGVERVLINDLNPKAIELAKASAALNGLMGKCEFHCEEANALLLGLASRRERFDIIDIDPFGSPAPFLDAAVRAVKDGGIIAATSTDTAVLFGLYPRVALRRYGGVVLRCDYSNELGVRLLLAGVVRCCIKLDLGFRPLFAHATRHYVRVYGRVVVGAKEADECLDALGYLYHCFKCGWHSTETNRCESCKREARALGPLWIGEVHDIDLVKVAEDEAKALGMKRVAKLLARARGEVGLPPGYHDLSKLADELERRTPSPDRLIEILRREGYKASRSSFNPSAIKSDAEVGVIKRLLLKEA